MEQHNRSEYETLELIYGAKSMEQTTCVGDLVAMEPWRVTKKCEWVSLPGEVESLSLVHVFIIQSRALGSGKNVINHG